MATISNRDRVGGGFELLAEGLEQFVDRHMSAAAGNAGGDWIRLLEARDGAKHGAKKTYTKNDPAVLLRVLTEDWRIFSDKLSRVEQSFASELHDTRNKWAHNDSFSADDTSRALDTMERILTAVGAPDQANAVRRSRIEAQRQAYESETKKLVKQQDVTPTIAGQGLKPWREVLVPHEDVASGNFSASEFAADLHTVAVGEATSEEYSDPVQFFRRTYLTEGLHDLLDRAVRRVGGDANASPIINLQTNFGGGKTHSMLALWHLMSGTPVSELPQEVQEVVAGRSLPAKVRRVAIVGTHLPPSGTTKQDGTVVNTVWGELAWQLGGKAAFTRVADADRSRTNPGEALREVISQYSPCIILIDEWVAYARQLWGREDLKGGTFDTQFTFAQSLTEVVKTIPSALLVISIPASHDPERDGQSGGSALEVGGPNGQAALQKLQNVVRRVADQWRPASAQESFEIVRRRLFEAPTAQALSDIGAVARQFVTFYGQHTGEFPREVTSNPGAYEDRIKRAYPIHPELFDRLYEDWSTLDRFQRTRGVLRLMSTVVHALWEAQDAGPMIMPGTVPLNQSKVAGEITQYLPDQWKPILDSDIDGTSSHPVKIDAERTTLGGRATTRRLARSIFIGSAPTLGSAHRGVERQRVWLGTAIPGDVVGNFGSAIELLSQRATYLYSEGNRYWFDTQPSVTRTAADHADSLRDRPEEAWTEIIGRLRNEQRSRGGFAGVHIAPDTTADIADSEEVRLVILHPSQQHTKGEQDSAAMVFAKEAFERRGSGQRTNRNMLVFLAPDNRRYVELDESVREYLAWKWVGDRIKELNLSPQQENQVASNRDRSDEAVRSRIAATYQWLLVSEQHDPARPPTIEVERADGANERLAERATDKLTRLGMLAGSVGARTIRHDLEEKLSSVWSRGHVSVGELWAYYCRYPYLTRLRDRGVLVDGVLTALASLVWQEESFALADGYDESEDRYLGLVVPSGDARYGQVTDTSLLVAPAAAARQLKEEASGPSVIEAVAEAAIEAGVARKQGGLGTADVGEAPGPSNTRFFGVYRIDPERYGRDLNKLSQEILQQIAAVDGASLEVTVEVQARRAEGFPDDKVRTLLENAKVLKFDQFGFEDE